MARVLVVTRSASVLGKAPAIATALHDAGFEVILVWHEHPTPRAESEPGRPVVGGQDSATVLEPVGVLAALEAARGQPQGGPAWQARIEDPGGQQRTEVAQFVVICQDAFFQAAAPLPFRCVSPEAVRGKRVLVVGDGSDAWDTACAIALLNEGRGVQLRTPAPAAVTAAPQQLGLGTEAGAGPAPPVPGSLLLDEARRRALQAALQPHYTAAAPGAVGRVLRAPTKRRFWAYVKGRAERAVRWTESGAEGGAAAEPPLQPAAAAAAVPAPIDHFTGPGSAPGSSTPDPPVVTVWAPSLRDPRVMPFLSPQLRGALLEGGGGGGAAAQESGSALAAACGAERGGWWEGPSLVLYRGMVHPDTPGLLFLGLESHPSSSPQLAQLQSRWLAALLMNRLHLPPAAAMRADIARQRAWRAAALAHPLMSTHGSLARAQERHYTQQLTADLEGLMEGRTALRRGGEGRQSRVIELRPGPEQVSAQRQPQLRMGLVAAVEGLSGHTSESGSGQQIAPNRSERRRRGSLLRRHLGAGELPGGGACSSGSNYRGSGGYFPMVGVGAATTQPGQPPSSAAAVDSPARDRRASLPGFRAVRQALTEQLKTTSSRLTSLRRRSTGWGDYHSDSGTVAPPPPPPLSTQSSRKAPGRDVPAGCAPPLVCPAGAAAPTAAAATVAAAAAPEATAGSAPRKAAPSGLGNAVSRSLPYIGAHASRCQVLSTEPDEFATGTAAPDTAPPPPPAPAAPAASPTSGSGYPASFRLDDAGRGGIDQGPPQHPQTLQQPRQAQHQVQGLGLPACVVMQSRDQEAETDPQVGGVAGLRTEESIMPLLDGERSRANRAGVEGGAFSRTQTGGSVGQVPLSGSGDVRGALMMHLFTADSAVAAPAEAAVAVALAGCSSKDLTPDGLSGISGDCDDGGDGGGGGGGVRSTQAERAGATEDGSAAVVDAGAARLSRPQSPAANSAAEVAPPEPFGSSLFQGAQSAAAGANVAVATAAAPAAAAGKACQVALALRASQGRLPVSPRLPMVQEAPESACLSHDAVSLNGLLAPGGEEEQEVTRQNGAEEQEKSLDGVAAETGGGGRIWSGNTGYESGRPGELRLVAAKLEPLSVPLPLLQSHLMQSGYAGYNAAEGGSGGGGGDAVWGQPSQPLPLVAPPQPQPQLAGKPGALYNSTPLPLLHGGVLRLSGVVLEGEEAEEEGDEVSPWIQVGCGPASPPAASEDGGSAAASCRGSTALTLQSSGQAEMMPQLQSLGRQHYQQQAQQPARSPRPVGRPTGSLQHAAVRPREAPPPGASASSRGWTLPKRDVPARSTTLVTPASPTAAQVEDVAQGGVAQGDTSAAAAAATGADGGGAVDVMRSQIAALRAHLLDPTSHPFPDILGGGGGAAKGPGRSTHRHVTATTATQHRYLGGSQQLPNVRAAAAAASEPPGVSFKTLSGLPTPARPLGRRSVAAVLAAHLGLGLGPKAPRASGTGQQPPTAIASLSPTRESTTTPPAPAADAAYSRASAIALTTTTTATSAPRPSGVTDAGRLPGSGGGSGGGTGTGQRPISAGGLPVVQGVASASSGAEFVGQGSGGARVSAVAAMSVDTSGGKWPPKTAPAAAAAASEPNANGLVAASSSVLSFLKTALMPSPGSPVAGSPSRADGAVTAAAAAAGNSARSPPGAPGLVTRSRLSPHVSSPGAEAGDLPSPRSVALTPVTPVAIPAGATPLATGDMQTGASPASAAASPFSPTPTGVAASQGCEGMSTTSMHLTVAAAATAVVTSPTKSLSEGPSPGPSPSPSPRRAGAEAGGLGGSRAVVTTGRTANVRRTLVMDFFTRGGASSSTAAVPEEGPAAMDGPAAAATRAGAAAAAAATGETFQAHGDRHCGAHNHHRRVSIESGHGVNGANMEYGSGVNGPFSLPIRKLQLPNCEPAHAGFQYPFGPTLNTSSHRPGNDPASSRCGGAGAVDPAISHQGGLNGRNRLMMTCGSPGTAAGPPGSASPSGGGMMSAFRSRRATLQAGADQLGSLLGRAADAAAVPYSKSSQLSKMSLNLHHRGAAHSIFDVGGGGGGGGVGDHGSDAEGKHMRDLAAAMGVHVGGSDTASDDGDSGVGGLDGGGIHDAGTGAGIGDVGEDGEQCGDGGAMLRALAEANVTVTGAISARSGGDDSGGVPATPAPTLLAPGCDTYTPAKPVATTSTAAAYTGTTVAYTPQPQQPQRLQRLDVTETPSLEQQHSQEAAEAAFRLRTRLDPHKVLPGSSAPLFHRALEPPPVDLSAGAEAAEAPPPPCPSSRAARPPPGRCSTVLSLEGSGRLLPAMLPEQLAEVEVEARTAAMALPGRRSPAWVVRRISEAKQEKLVSEVSAWLKEALEKGARRTSAAGATWNAK